MTFSPKGLLMLVAFAAIVILAVNAREGNITPAFAVVGIAAILVIEAVGLFAGPPVKRTPKRLHHTLGLRGRRP